MADNGSMCEKAGKNPTGSEVSTFRLTQNGRFLNVGEETAIQVSHLSGGLDTVCLSLLR